MSGHLLALAGLAGFALGIWVGSLGTAWMIRHLADGLSREVGRE
jgi:hypothetical protein